MFCIYKEPAEFDLLPIVSSLALSRVSLNPRCARTSSPAETDQGLSARPADSQASILQNLTSAARKGAT